MKKVAAAVMKLSDQTDDAIKYDTWQHPALGHRTRFVVSRTICYRAIICILRTMPSQDVSVCMSKWLNIHVSSNIFTTE